MKFLRKSLDALHPYFTKGGKLEKLYPLYEAIDTFLYSPGHVNKGMTHVRDGMDLKRMMITVAAKCCAAWRIKTKDLTGCMTAILSMRTIICGTWNSAGIPG